MGPRALSRVRVRSPNRGKENEAAARLYRDLGYQLEEAFDRYELEVEGHPT